MVGNVTGSEAINWVASSSNSTMVSLKGAHLPTLSLQHVHIVRMIAGRVHFANQNDPNRHLQIPCSVLADNRTGLENFCKRYCPAGEH